MTLLSAMLSGWWESCWMDHPGQGDMKQKWRKSRVWSTQQHTICYENGSNVSSATAPRPHNMPHAPNVNRHPTHPYLPHSFSAGHPSSIVRMPNIFFTQENLVLAFPLLAACSIYVRVWTCWTTIPDIFIVAELSEIWVVDIIEENFPPCVHYFSCPALQAFFKFVPLKIGLPIVGIVSMAIQARAKLIASEYNDMDPDGA